MNANAVTARTEYDCAVLIGGAVRDAPMMPVRNPARVDEIVGRVALAGVDHVEEAVRAATVAARSWAALSPHERGALLRDAAAQIEPRVEELAALLTREQGKTLLEARSDVRGSVLCLRYFAELAEAALGEEPFRDDERATILLGRRPVGVTGVIVPWNSPVHLAFLGISPSLAAGNPVIVKPSEFAPLALGEVLRILAAALPPGVVGLLPGAAEAGAAMSAHPGIRKIFFTGSTATGKRIMSAAAGNLKRLSLELGGNDPAIVLDSAVVDDELALEVARGSFALSGQVCFGIKRIYVHRSLYAEFLDAFVAAVDRIVVGDGLREDVTMGPVNNRPQWERVQQLIEVARSSGGELRELGQQAEPAGWDRGHFIRPTVVTGLTPDHPLVVQEQFGPVVPVLAYDGVDEVIAQINASEFGLGASLWSPDTAQALALARRLESGSVFINAHRAGVSDVATPFGGFKQSGIGRGHGLPALYACLETQAIVNVWDRTGFPPSPLH